MGLTTTTTTMTTRSKNHTSFFTKAFLVAFGLLTLATTRVAKADNNDGDIISTTAVVPTGPCIATTTGEEPGRKCHSLFAEHDESEVVATFCLELLPLDGTEDDPNATAILHATFDAYGDWKMVTTKFWLGEDVWEFPRLGDGSPDVEAFPYFYCNYTSFDAWEIFEPISFDCTDLEESIVYSVVAYAEVEKWNEHGKPIPESRTRAYAYDDTAGFGSAWIGWYYLVIDCNCDGNTTTPGEGDCPTTPELVLQTPGEKECHPIVAGGSEVSVQAGTVCIEIKEGNILHVTFQAGEFWAFLRTQLWVGRGSNETNALDIMPHFSSGAPNTKKFNYFSCDYQGETIITFTINLNYECVPGDLLKIYVVAHSKVEQVDEDGDLIPDTDLDVFAFEHTGSSDTWYGYFDFLAECTCPPPPKTPPVTYSPTDTPTEGPTSLPTGETDRSTGLPTSSPTAGPTSEPTEGPTFAPTSSPTDEPTVIPTPQGPTEGPTNSPTSSPTAGPTTSPTPYGPTEVPTGVPTDAPTSGPTEVPTSSPTSLPTGVPTSGPTAGPTSSPTSGPTSGK